jgi:hypothetical protein
LRLAWPLAKGHFRKKGRVAEATTVVKMVESSEINRSLTPVPTTTTFGTKDAAYQIMAKLNPPEAQL